jgi:hypothetical protein
MEWQPEKKVIAIGWRSGEITTYNNSEEKVFEQSSSHKSPINVVRWNQNGTRMLSSDQVGVCVGGRGREGRGREGGREGGRPEEMVEGGGRGRGKEGGWREGGREGERERRGEEREKGEAVAVRFVWVGDDALYWFPLEWYVSGMEGGPIREAESTPSPSAPPPPLHHSLCHDSSQYLCHGALKGEGQRPGCL